MPVSDKQKQYADKHIKTNYDEIKFRVPKGRKEQIQEYAASKGESTNAFLNRIVSQEMGLGQEE